jgi:hypothetical protein
MRQTQRVLFALAVSAALLAAQDDPPGRAGRLSYLEGPASFQPAGVQDWVDAALNRTLTTGDQLWVSDGGRAEVQVGSTTYRLNSNSAFQFLNLDDETEQVSLSEGTLTIRLRRPESGQVYEVDTPNVAITLQASGAYRIDADPNSQTTRVIVWRGSAEITGGGQAFLLEERQEAAVTGDQQISYNVYDAPGPDAWDTWSGQRDSRRDRSVSARYVSPEVTGYDDLDGYGRWSSTPDYGDVWYPSAVAADWAPYRYGHWAWVSPWGWTWVDDASWGFAPFHYGRWAYIGGAWGWCPGPASIRPVYAPALVAWVGGGGGGFGVGFAAGAAAVGWFALGPREPFFPTYHVSPGYFANVNVSNTVINRTVINNYYNTTYITNRTNISNISYRNQGIRGAVMAVEQNQFASGQSLGRVARVVPVAQVRQIGIMAAPSVTPQRSSVLGVHAATVGRAPRPPAAVLSRAVVARRAPPAAPVEFSRQQSMLARDPGRPLAPAAIQQMRQAQPAARIPVRIVAPVQARPVAVRPNAARPAPPNMARPGDSRPSVVAPRQMEPAQIHPQQPDVRPAAPSPETRPNYTRPAPERATPPVPAATQTPQRPNYTAPEARPQRAPDAARPATPSPETRPNYTRPAPERATPQAQPEQARPQATQPAEPRPRSYQPNDTQAPRRPTYTPPPERQPRTEPQRVPQDRAQPDRSQPDRTQPDRARPQADPKRDDRQPERTR